MVTVVGGDGGDGGGWGFKFKLATALSLWCIFGHRGHFSWQAPRKPRASVVGIRAVLLGCVDFVAGAALWTWW